LKTELLGSKYGGTGMLYQDIAYEHENRVRIGLEA